MASLEEIRASRMEKLGLLEKAGMKAYPIHVERDGSLAQIVSQFDELMAGNKTVIIAGRIMSLRPQGGLTFLTIQDGSGSAGFTKFQVALKKEDVAADTFELFEKTVDIGDFIGLSGTLFVTKRGEKTLLIKKWTMLAKSLRPLPEKWHGLQDVEERFRHRYLDVLMSPEVRRRFEIRSKLIAEIRNFYNSEGFIEVETPYLQVLAGGATAAPFKTHHNALDMDFYLTIAQELYLKQLLVAGFERVYEIGRKFRNEGVDTTHNPEFTMLESQEAYADAASQRIFTERLVKTVVKNIFGAFAVDFDGQKIDFEPAFRVVTFADLLKEYADIDISTITLEQALDHAKKLKVEISKTDALEKVLDNIYKKTARPKLIAPTFIIDYPVEFNPFAKRKEQNPKLIDRFQLIAGGLEFVNAFSELNNPVDQSDRYKEQDKKRKAGEAEISPSDQVYLEAMEYGMPPNGGIGIGIDRLAMILTDSRNIKEVILFPTLRPR